MKHRRLGSDAVMQLMVKLGTEWRRSPVLWKWGGQFESFREYQNEHRRSRNFVYLDWQADTPQSFGGQLTLQLFGDDQSFLDSILNHCRDLAAFSKVEIPPPSAAESLDRERLPERLGRVESPPSTYAPPPHTRFVDVGISYAGDRPNALEDWEKIPETSIEKWPRTLAAKLRELRFVVEEYRTEQGRPYFEGTAARRAYLDQLTGRDFAVAFLSNEYLKSPWCMYEFLQIYQRTPDGSQNLKTCRLAIFQDAAFSDTNLKQEDPKTGHSRAAAFWNHWKKKWLKEVNRRIRLDAKAKKRTHDDTQVYAELLDVYPWAEWAKCVRDDSYLHRISNAIQNNWKLDRISYTPEPGDTARWCEEICASTGLENILFDFARTAFIAKQYSRAAVLFLHAFFGKDPDGKRGPIEEELARKLNSADLDMVRSWMLGQVVEMKLSGLIYQDWRDLLAQYAAQYEAELKAKAK